MRDAIPAAALDALVGTELGVSPWFTLDQDRIDAFADATLDHQYIHVDRARAKETPFGGTIAHGLLTLSMIVHLCLDLVPRLEGTRMLLNYGFDRVRFPTFVRSGSRIRARASLRAAKERSPRQYLLTLDVTIEIEHETKPAVVAEWLSFHVVG
jgi:acyl dehydratase